MVKGMTRFDGFGLSADLPKGWSAVVRRGPDLGPASRGTAGTGGIATVERSMPVLHASTRPLLPDTGDFGSGMWEALGPDDVFVALVEYGTEVANQGLFETQGMPRLAPSAFAPNRMPRYIPGRSASQRFFSTGGRAFCLFTVIGEHSRRMVSVPRAVAAIRTFGVVDAATMRARGVVL
jgi:hypothetical protein